MASKTAARVVATAKGEVTSPFGSQEADSYIWDSLPHDRFADQIGQYSWPCAQDAEGSPHLGKFQSVLSRQRALAADAAV